jgi:hypothetical protein
VRKSFQNLLRFSIIMSGEKNFIPLEIDEKESTAEDHRLGLVFEPNRKDITVVVQGGFLSGQTVDDLGETKSEGSGKGSNSSIGDDNSVGSSDEGTSEDTCDGDSESSNGDAVKKAGNEENSSRK